MQGIPRDGWFLEGFKGFCGIQKVPRPPKLFLAHRPLISPPSEPLTLGTNGETTTLRFQTPDLTLVACEEDV